MEIGLITAFLGGTLALLSPCSALLLPAFFGSTVGADLRLLVHGGVFYLGLTATLVPFGLGLGALGSVAISQRGLIIAIASIVLVALGFAQALGFGFDIGRMVPGLERLRSATASRQGLLQTLLLGAVGGVAGFCAGPILGAVLTLAATQGSSLAAGTMLAVYGAGMVVPLMILAAVWTRLNKRDLRLLRGRPFRVLGRELHTISVVTGLFLVAVGIAFWHTNGFVGSPGLVPVDVQMWAQQHSSLFANPLLDVGAVVAVAALALAVWARGRRSADRQYVSSRNRGSDGHGSRSDAEESR